MSYLMIKRYGGISHPFGSYGGTTKRQYRRFEAELIGGPSFDFSGKLQGIIDEVRKEKEEKAARELATKKAETGS